MAEALREHGEGRGEDEFQESLAYHYGAGGDSRATALYAELAGNKAMGRGALDRARVHYHSALGALDRLPRSVDASRAWLRIARWFGLASTYNPSAEQLPIFAEAVKRARAHGSPRSVASAEYWLGYMNSVLGHDRDAAGDCERALAALPPGDALESYIVLLLGQSLARGGHYAAAGPLLDRGLGGLRASLGEPEALLGYAYGLSCKALMLADLGRFAEAHARFDEALAMVAGMEHPIEAAVLSNYVHLFMWQGAMPETLEVATHAEQVCARLKASYMYIRNRAAAAYARWSISQNADDVAQLLDTAAWLEENGSQQLMASVYARLAEVLGADGQVRDARHYAAMALRRVRAGNCLGAGGAMRAVARLDTEWGRPARAERYLQRALQAARRRDARPDIAMTTLCAAEIALARGEREQASVLLDEADAAFAALDMRWQAHAVESLRTKIRGNTA